MWTEEAFLADLERRAGADVIGTARRIAEWATARGLEVRFGGGRIDGSLTPSIERSGMSYYLATVWSYGKLEFAFEQLRNRPPYDDEARRRRLVAEINEIPGVDVPADAFNRRPSITLRALGNEAVLEAVLSVWAGFCDEVANL